MKKFRVRLRPCVEDVFVTVEAVDEQMARDVAEEKYQNEEIEIGEIDSSALDYAEAISVEEVK